MVVELPLVGRQQSWRFWIVVVLLACAAPLAAQATFVVSSPPDVGPGFWGGLDQWTVRTGFVIDEQGRPLTGVRISAVDDSSGWIAADLEAAQLAVTDERGAFQVEVNGVGQIRTGETTAGALVLSRRGRASAVLQLPPGNEPLPTVCLQPGRTFLVRVLDDAGEPVPGVTVQGEQFVLGAHMAVDLVRRTAAVTDEKGIAKMVGAALRGVELRVETAGWAATRTLPAAHEGLVELRTERTGFVRGRVLGEDGEPLLLAEQRVQCVDGFGTVQSALTDSEGRFEFARRSATRHHVGWIGVREENPGQQFRNHMVVGDPVVVEPDSDAPVEVVAELDPDRVLASDRSGVRVVLRVVDDASGKPVSGAAVFWAAQDPVLMEQMLAMGMGTARPDRVTDEAGGLELGDPDGTPGAAAATPLVVADGYAPWRAESLELPEAGADPIEFEVRLQPEAVATGVVRDAVSGEPMAGVTVCLTPDQMRFPSMGTGLRNGRWRAVTDEDGAFRIGSLRPGNWELKALADGRPTVESVGVRAVASGPTRPVDVKIPKGVALEGRIAGAERLPPGTLVRVRSVGVRAESVLAGMMLAQQGLGRTETASQQQRLAEDGTFSFRGFPVGSYLVEVLTPGRNLGEVAGATEVGRVTLEGGAVEAGFEATAALAGVVRGRLKLPEGIEAPHGRLLVLAEPTARREEGAAAWVMLSAPATGPQAYLDRDGSFVLRLRPGTWKLSVQDVAARSKLMLDETVEVAAGSEHDLSAELEFGAVRVTLGEDPQTPGSVGAKLEFARNEEGPGAAGGLVVFDGSVGAAGGQQLAGLPRERVVLLPCHPHELRLWRARQGVFAPSQGIAQVIRIAGRGQHDDMDVAVGCTPRVGEVLDVAIGLGKD